MMRTAMILSGMDCKDEEQRRRCQHAFTLMIVGKVGKSCFRHKEVTDEMRREARGRARPYDQFAALCSRAPTKTLRKVAFRLRKRLAGTVCKCPFAVHMEVLRPAMEARKVALGEELKARARSHVLERSCTRRCVECRSLCEAAETCLL